MGKASEMRIIGLLLLCGTLLIVWRTLPQSPSTLPPAEWQSYTWARQQAAHQQGKPVLIEFSAAW